MKIEGLSEKGHSIVWYMIINSGLCGALLIWVSLQPDVRLTHYVFTDIGGLSNIILVHLPLIYLLSLIVVRIFRGSSKHPVELTIFVITLSFLTYFLEGYLSEKGNNNFVEDVSGELTLVCGYNGLYLIFLLFLLAYIEECEKPKVKPKLENNDDQEKAPETIGGLPLAGSPEFDAMVKDGTLTVMPALDDFPAHNKVTHGSANFLPDIYKENANVRNPQNGLWLGGGFMHHDEGNLCTVAASRSGKGAALIIPNLLIERDYPHSFVVFDPKGTNTMVTARYQQERGQKVVIIDPYNLQHNIKATHGIKGGTFNPLDFVSKDEKMMVSEVVELVLILLPDSKSNKDEFWILKARNIYEGVILHILTSPDYEGRRNLNTLYAIVQESNWFNEPEEDKEASGYLMEMFRNYACNESIKKIAGGLINEYRNTPKTFTDIVSSATNGTNWLKDPFIQDNIESSSVDITELDKGGITLYICLEFKKIKGLAIWLRLLLGACISHNIKSQSFKKAWSYYLLDEFPAMGFFPEVVSSLAEAAEYQVRFWLFAQNLPQFDNYYSQDYRNQILGSCRIFQSFVISDLTTAKYVSERLGNKTESFIKQSNSSNYNDGWAKTRDSFNTSGGQSSGFSSSEELTGRPLLTVNEIEAEKRIITFSEIGTFRLKRWMYWQKPTNLLEEKYYNEIRPRADKNPNYDD